MAVPIAANVTFDIYRAGVTPPSAAASSGVSGHLRGDWRGGQEAGERQLNALSWTHILLVDVSVDLRDGYVGQGGYTGQDAVYIPNNTGTRFEVVFIERIQRDTPNEHKRVYLDRATPSWPTNEL